jgi:hypothetical protein
MGGTVYIRRDEVQLSLTFSVDTNVYANNDLIADTQEVGVVGQSDGDIVTLDSLHLLDKADQKNPVILVFLNANTSLGTENSAPSISDTDAANIIGMVSIAAADYVDVGGASIASKAPALKMKLASGSSKIWVGIIGGTGTPTYAASDLVGSFIFSR